MDDVGGSFHAVLGDDVPGALLGFARGADATRIVLGSSRRRAWQNVLGPGVGATVARESGDTDVHIVTHEHAAAGRPRLPGRLPVHLGRPRAVAGWLLGCGGPVLLTLLLTRGVGDPGLPTALLLFPTLTVGAALVGGVFPAVAAALLGSLLLNYYFAAPSHAFTISNPRNLLALVVLVAVGIAVTSGSLSAEDTPGGGPTMVLTLRCPAGPADAALPSGFSSDYPSGFSSGRPSGLLSGFSSDPTAGREEHNP